VDLLRLLSGALQPHNSAEATSQVEKNSQNAPAKPLRILMAEDSLDNRLLMEMYFKGSPHQLTFVDDGKAAVERFLAERFDLILMDMQMPVMDGLTATRAIRVIEQKRIARAIPIIALTANALSQDLELSISAGCNEHLSKPISKHKLLNTIAKYEPMKTCMPEPSADSTEPIRIEMPSGLEDLVPAYLAARQKELPEMLALLAAADFDRLVVLAHNLKGTGGSYELPALTRLGAILERSAKQRDIEEINVRLAELGSYLNLVQLIGRGEEAGNNAIRNVDTGNATDVPDAVCG
jgi:two-component system, sensor histidine kinase and response regulator